MLTLKQSPACDSGVRSSAARRMPLHLDRIRSVNFDRPTRNPEGGYSVAGDGTAFAGKKQPTEKMQMTVGK